MMNLSTMQKLIANSWAIDEADAEWLRAWVVPHLTPLPDRKHFLSFVHMYSREQLRSLWGRNLHLYRARYYRAAYLFRIILEEKDE